MKKKVFLILIGVVILFRILDFNSVQAATAEALHVKIDESGPELWEFHSCGLVHEHFDASGGGYNGCPIFLQNENGFGGDDRLIIWVHKGETISKESSSYLTDGLWYDICPDQTSPGCKIDWGYRGNAGMAWLVAEEKFGSDFSDHCDGNCTLSVSNTEYQPKKDLYCNDSGYWEEREPAPPITCTDTDGGEDWDTYGECKENGEVKCEDICYDEDTLWECRCENHSCRVISHTCASGEHCLNGACVPEAAHICEDTDEDSGGNTQVWDERGSCYEDGSWVDTDECISSTKLKEWYCDGTECKSIIHDCSPYGCEDGICTLEAPVCEDTDGGEQFSVKGSCYENEILQGTDSCVDNTFLKEWYCDGANCTYITQNCSPGNCQDGKCAGIPDCMRPACEGLESGSCKCGTKVIENQYCCANLSEGYDEQDDCLAECGGLPPTCGNGTCDAGENSTNCPQDCAAPPPTKRCVEDLGGYCCDPQYCLSGHKITGATDCSHCCDSSGNCTATPPTEEEGIIEFGPYTETTEFQGLVDNVMSFIFKIAIVIVPLIILIGAFYLVTAGGDIKRIEQGKRLIIWVLIGFAIVLLSKGIVAMINQLFGMPGG